jgi:hypothetical protein
VNYADRQLTSLPNGLLVEGERVRTYNTGAARADGETNDRAAIVRALAKGEAVDLLPGETYFISGGRIELPSNAVIRGDGTQTFVMDLASFTNNDRNAYMDAAAVLFYANSQTNIRLEGFKIIPSVQNANRVRIPITSITKRAGQNIVVKFSRDSASYLVFADGQKVTLYGMDGAVEVDGETLAGAANACEFTVTAYNASARSFELSGTSATNLTAYVSGGYIEPKRFLCPIAVTQCTGVKSINVEMVGFTAGYGHAIESCTDIDIVPNIHDWYTNYCWQDGSEAQQSGVEIDQTTVAGVGTVRTSVKGGIIRDFVKGAVASYQQDNPTAERLQNDAIHGAGRSDAPSTPTDGLLIDGVTISGVDEATDFFGDNLRMVNCLIDNITSHALKAYYGAQKVIFAGNIVSETGRQTINMSSGSTAVTDRPNSVISINDNIFAGVSNYYDSLGVEHAVLKMDDNGTSGYNGITKVYSNGNIYNTGTSGTHCIDNSLRQYQSEFYSNNDAFILGPGATGYFNRGRFRRIPITGISKANPGVVTMAANTEFGMFATSQVVAIYGVGGMVEVTDGYYTIGSNPAGGTFNLQDASGTNINTTGYTTFTSGGFVQLGGRIQIVNPKNKTMFKATMQTSQTVAAATLSAVLNFDTFIFDQRDEGDIATKGPIIQIPGYYRVTCAARTTGATPSGTTESTQLQILVTGAGNPLTSFALPRDSEGFTYFVSGVVWCDEGDAITAQVVFTANGSGVSFSADHRFTYLLVEMV